ncbi:MAG: hypothetical protein VYE04_05410 [Pseudomonadota bacterium]|nr:hypothetical protein [Pseudomonadota bacterium]
MIPYIKRTRNYYAAQGYPAYKWANHSVTPFTPMEKPVAQSRLVLLTTAAPFRPDLPDQGPGAKYNAAAKFYDVYTRPIEPVPDLRISHIGYDRKHCEAKDPRTWLPIDVLIAARTDRLIGELAEELIGIPTNRSQRVTVEQDAKNALAQVKRLGADAALLVPT